jgi:hypothetical protein
MTVPGRHASARKIRRLWRDLYGMGLREVLASSVVGHMA